MLIRAVIKYFRKRIGRIREELRPRDHEEEEILFELFIKRNYVPHSKTEVFRSFNTEYREWIFSLPGFCRAFNLYYGKKRSYNRRLFNIWEDHPLSSYSLIIIWRYLTIKSLNMFRLSILQIHRKFNDQCMTRFYRSNARIHGYPRCPSLRRICEKRLRKLSWHNACARE